jgi:hypothetical protein
MASLSSGLNPDVVKTALDDVFYAQFDGEMSPHLADATTSDILKQATVDRSALIWEQYKGVGMWDTIQEEEDLPSTTPRVDNQKTFPVIEFAKSVDIPRNFFDDEMHEVVNNTIRDFAETARITRDSKSIEIFRDAFAGSLYTTADGATIVSDSHTNLNGDTIDNKITGGLSPDTLNEAIVKLAEQKAQDGTIRGHIPATLFVPLALFKTAVEVTESTLLADTAENNKNWVSSKYGIRLYTSPFLGAAAGGSDSAWFLLGKNHSIYRWVRRPLDTTLTDWRLQRNNNYIYKGSFREMVGAMSYEGIVGSTGLG